jgi:hypothetical protein
MMGQQLEELESVGHALTEYHSYIGRLADDLRDSIVVQASPRLACGGRVFSRLSRCRSATTSDFAT